jgi:phosphoglycolate phosphatase-like HAD superfamily hydrolase
MIRCVVFDFDGTLVDSNDIKRQTFFEIVRSWDPAGDVVSEVIERWPAANRYEKTYRIAEGLSCKELLPLTSSVDEWATRLADEYTTQCERAIAACAEMPGATQALDELSDKGLLLFINSATPVEPLRRLLELRDWERYFRAVYGAEASKADNLRHIALDTGVEPDEIIHVGDQFDDLQGAAQFGCHFVAMAACNAGPASRESALKVKDLRELSALFTKITQETS